MKERAFVEGDIFSDHCFSLKEAPHLASSDAGQIQLQPSLEMTSAFTGKLSVAFSMSIFTKTHMLSHRGK